MRLLQWRKRNFIEFIVKYVIFIDICVLNKIRLVYKKDMRLFKDLNINDLNIKISGSD